MITFFLCAIEKQKNCPKNSETGTMPANLTVPFKLGSAVHEVLSGEEGIPSKPAAHFR